MKKHKNIRTAGLIAAAIGMVMPTIMHDNTSSGIYGFAAIFLGFSIAISAHILVKEKENS